MPMERKPTSTNPQSQLKCVILRSGSCHVDLGHVRQEAGTTHVSREGMRH